VVRGGRIGYAIDRWMPYITGGEAFGDVKMTTNTGASETHTRFGWTVGAGVEHAFLSPWTFNVEYLYMDLGKANCSARPASSTPTSTSRPAWFAPVSTSGSDRIGSADGAALPTSNDSQGRRRCVGPSLTVTAIDCRMP
jgi:hypothetical protein